VQACENYVLRTDYPPGVGPGIDRSRPTVGLEAVAQICGCSPAEVERWRKTVLPRPKGSSRDWDAFDVAEAVAIAAATVIKTWRVKANIDQFVARLSLIARDDRDWVAVYESRKELRTESAPFTLDLWGKKRGAIFDPSKYYSAFDAASNDRESL
jgi:hypothetical protein